MIERAITAGVPFSWVASDEVYGGNPKLRARLGERQVERRSLPPFGPTKMAGRAFP